MFLRSHPVHCRLSGAAGVGAGAGAGAGAGGGTRNVLATWGPAMTCQKYKESPETISPQTIVAWSQVKLSCWPKPFAPCRVDLSYESYDVFGRSIPTLAEVLST